MYVNKDPVRTRFDTVRTIASVVSAVCLVIIATTLIVAGAYTANTVNTLQSTYHPERLASMLSDASDTMGTIHATTSMLKSSNGDVSLMDEYHKFMHALTQLSSSIRELHVDQVLQESNSWRDMSTHFMSALKKTLDE